MKAVGCFGVLVVGVEGYGCFIGWVGGDEKGGWCGVGEYMCGGG